MTTLGKWMIALAMVASTGCYCCRTSYNPCTGTTYHCTRWGFAKPGGCEDCLQGCGCDVGCDIDCDSACEAYPEPGCEVPCVVEYDCDPECGLPHASYDDSWIPAGRSYDDGNGASEPPRTFRDEQPAPAMPDAANDAETARAPAGWQPTSYYHVQGVGYPLPR